MVRRALDVLFQHLGRLLAGIVLIPMVVGGAALVFTRADVVSAKLWTDKSAVSGDAGTSRDPTAADFDPSLTPAQRQAAVLAELVQTNSFMNRAFQAQPAAGAIPRRDRQPLQQAVRAGFTATALGTNVLELAFTTPRAAEGVALMRSIISAYGQTLADLQAKQAAAAASAVEKQLDGARQSMDDAVNKAQAYAANHHLSTLTATEDPDYASLATDAQTKTNAYLGLVDQYREEVDAQQAATSAVAALYHVMDPPGATPQPLTSRSPAVRAALYGLLAVLALEVGFVYNSARRDPRIRTGTEVARALGVRALGAVPLPKSR